MNTKKLNRVCPLLCLYNLKMLHIQYKYARLTWKNACKQNNLHANDSHWKKISAVNNLNASLMVINKIKLLIYYVK